MKTDKYKLIKSFMETHKDEVIIFDLANKMFEEGKEDPAYILTHVIIYQYNLLVNKGKLLSSLEEAA